MTPSKARQMSFTLIVLLFLSVFVSKSNADWLLEFKDGAANEVWTSFEKEGSQYCTVKEYLGKYCVNKSDVKKFYTVPDGTLPNDFTMNIGGVQTSSEASAINQRSINEMNDHAAQRNREIDARAKAEQKQINRNRRDGKADWAQ